MTEQEMEALVGTRYEVDFRLIPEICLTKPAAILGALLHDEATEIFADIYNNRLKFPKVITANDFSVKRYMDEDDFIFYITMPDGCDDGTIMNCLAYGIAFVRNGDKMALQLFILKEDEGKANSICGLDVYLDHKNIGEAYATDEENARLMLATAKSNSMINTDCQVNF